MSSDEVIKYYSDLSWTYESRRYTAAKDRLLSDLQISWYGKNLPSTPGTTLEVGCGTGRVTRGIRSRSGHLVATDGSLQMLKLNKESTARDHAPSPDYVVCDATHLPFRPRSFDCVVGSRLYWHIPDYPRALKEALDASNEQSVLLFDFPNLHGPFSILSHLRNNKYDVLTLFTTKTDLDRLLGGLGRTTVYSSASALFFGLPSKLLGLGPIRGALRSVENLPFRFFHSLFYSYSLVRVAKPRVQDVKSGITDSESSSG